MLARSFLAVIYGDKRMCPPARLCLDSRHCIEIVDIGDAKLREGCGSSNAETALLISTAATTNRLVGIVQIDFLIDHDAYRLLYYSDADLEGNRIGR